MQLVKTVSKLTPLEYTSKDDLRILTVCNYGQVRSVAMCHGFQRRGFMNVYATGVLAQYPITLDRHCVGSDLIIICNKPNLEARFYGEPHPDTEGIVSVLNRHRDRMVICGTIGTDKWGNPRHDDLVDIVEAFLEDVT